MNTIRTEIAAAALGTAEFMPDAAQQSYTFRQDFTGFAGHFPGYPILPGVLQVLMTQMLAEQLVGEPLLLKQLVRVKFTAELRHDQRIDVSVKRLDSAEPARFDCKLSSGEKTATSFTMVLGKGQE